jgi:hypothetical protein
MIFVCSPYRGKFEHDNKEIQELCRTIIKKHNIEQARRYCREIMLMGDVPFAPHLYFTQFLDDNDPTERNKGIEAGMRMMYDCSEVWVFGDVISDGMRREIEFAKQIGKAVKYVGTGHDL